MQDDQEFDETVIYPQSDYHMPLTWLDRWRLRREFKREQRAERKTHKRLLKAARRELREGAKLRAIKATERDGSMLHDAHTALMIIATDQARDLDKQQAYVRANAASRVIDAARDYRDRRFKYIALVGSWLVALYIATMLTMCVGCFGGHRFAQPEGAQVRDYPAQRAAAIQIDTVCGRGSGVLLNAQQAFTAYHVVMCGKALSPLLLVTAESGLPYTAVVEAVDEEHDLARIRIAAPVGDVHPPMYARPEVSASLWMSIATAAPERQVLLGHVNAIDKTQRIEHSAPIWFGNSGSGTYDDAGRLIGVLSSLKWCDDFSREAWLLLELDVGGRCGGYSVQLVGSKVMP